jgi:hypothetical protein
MELSSDIHLNMRQGTVGVGRRKTEWMGQPKYASRQTQTMPGNEGTWDSTYNVLSHSMHHIKWSYLAFWKAMPSLVRQGMQGGETDAAI